MPRKKQTPLSLQGSVYLADAQRVSLTAAQIDLLKAIRATGSITAAAKQVGISYKTAWSRVDAMNNLSRTALVMRSPGGAGGGGTRLTEQGEAMIAGFEALASQHRAFIERMGQQLHSVDDVTRFIRHIGVSTSARNQFLCRVETITRGGVNAELQLSCGPAVTLTAHITMESLRAMGLDTGSEVVALIKSSWILLSLDANLLTSARNQLRGTITRVAPGKVNSEVSLDLGEGKSLCAIVTNTSVRQMGLKAGLPATALFKASSVVLVQI